MKTFPEFIKVALEEAFGPAFTQVERDPEDEWESKRPAFKLSFFGNTIFEIEGDGPGYGIQPYNRGRCEEYWEVKESADWVASFKADIRKSLMEDLVSVMDQVDKLQERVGPIRAMIKRLEEW